MLHYRFCLIVLASLVSGLSFAQAPADKFLDLAPAAPLRSAQPFEQREIWKYPVPRSRIHGGIEISRFVMERELQGAIRKAGGLDDVAVKNIGGRYVITRQLGWDLRIVRAELLLSETPEKGDKSEGEVSFLIRAQVLESDKKTLVAADKVTQRNQAGCRQLVAAIRSYFGDTEKLEALDDSWKKLGQPATPRELYIARARAKALPVPGLKYDEIVEIWGKPLRQPSQSAVDLSGNVFYPYGPGKELRVPFSGGEVSGQAEIVDVKPAQ